MSHRRPSARYHPPGGIVSVLARDESGVSAYRQKYTCSPTRFMVDWTTRAFAAAPNLRGTATGVSPLSDVRRPVRPGVSFLDMALVLPEPEEGRTNGRLPVGLFPQHLTGNTRWATPDGIRAWNRDLRTPFTRRMGV